MNGAIDDAGLDQPGEVGVLHLEGQRNRLCPRQRSCPVRRLRGSWRGSLLACSNMRSSHVPEDHDLSQQGGRRDGTGATMACPAGLALRSVKEGCVSSKKASAKARQL
jgi:hypothetical protein